MRTLETSARRVAELMHTADNLFACPPLASLLPKNVHTAADAILRARDTDEARDAIDDLLRDATFLPSITPFPKGLSRDVPGDMIRLRHALGAAAGARAAVGVRRIEELTSAIAREERGIASRTSQDATSENERRVESLMDFACADMPVEVSRAVLALGRGMVAWIVILRADECASSVPAVLVDLMADLFADCVYPLLRIAGSIMPVAEDVLPPGEIINLADAVKRWHTALQETERAAQVAEITGMGMCGPEIGDADEGHGR